MYISFFHPNTFVPFNIQSHFHYYSPFWRSYIEQLIVHSPRRLNTIFIPSIPDPSYCSPLCSSESDTFSLHFTTPYHSYFHRVGLLGDLFIHRFLVTGVFFHFLHKTIPSLPSQFKIPGEGITAFISDSSLIGRTNNFASFIQCPNWSSFIPRNYALFLAHFLSLAKRLLNV